MPFVGLAIAAVIVFVGFIIVGLIEDGTIR